MSVTFDESWKLALVGRNGRGKTTLMKLLLGELAFSGQIHSDKAFIYFPQSVADPTMLTKYVLDELYDAPDWQIQRELNLLDFPLDSLWRPFESLSGGEQTKVLLAGLFLDEGNFPLIDEPTNHLDLASRAKIAQYLQSKKTGYIVSSHDRQFLNVVSDHLLAIERQDITLLATNFSTYELEKKRRDHFELAENEKLKSEISRLKQTAREKAEWSRDRERDKYGNPNQKGSGAIGGSGFIGARAARMMKKAKVLEHRMTSEIAEKEKLLKNLEKVDQLAMHYQPSHHQVLLFEEELTVTFDGKALFSPIKLGQKAREITAITGPNGVGKSQLLQQLIASAEKRQLRISCVRQLYGDNQGSLKSFADKHGLDYPDFLNNLRKLGMPREAFSKKIEQLSMGQQKKVELAKSLATPAELFIWDEPLNYLDVFNQEQIEVLLQTVKPAMLIVEHDAQFIENVADQVIELKTSED
ncbi:MAG: ATP-binding cassette domain-containing protein [Streptococcaceae bacterium]|nr:ATP-binding cassette domain-containing protein [Streptococcaceae bacterium]